jgi:hypothetical protein
MQERSDARYIMPNLFQATVVGKLTRVMLEAQVKELAVCLVQLGVQLSIRQVAQCFSL